MIMSSQSSMLKVQPLVSDVWSLNFNSEGGDL